MTLEQVIHAKELVVGTIREQGGELIIQMSTERGTTGGILFKDSLGFTVGRLDSSGNFHIKGDFLKDL